MRLKRQKSGMLLSVVALASLVAVGAMSNDITASVSAIKNAASYHVSKNGGTFYSDYSSKEEMLEAGEDLAKEIAGEGMVLLKNDGNLPLTDAKKVSIFGKNSVDPAYDGGGSGGAKGSRHKVDIYEGLENSGFTCNPALKNFYNREDRSGISRQTLQDIFKGPVDIGETSVDLYDNALKSTFNAYNDAAIVVITRVGSEGSDNGTSNVRDHDGDAQEEAAKKAAGNDKYYHYNCLSKNERDMIDMVKASGFGKIVLVINTPSAMELGDYENDPAINGIIWAGQPGYQGFNALGEILRGTLNPSGHLSDTFMADMRKDPTYANFGDGSQNSEEGLTPMAELLDKDGNPVAKPTNGSSMPGMGGGDSNSVNNDNPTIRKASSKGGTMTNNYYMVEYEEGIYVGYRYYETKYTTMAADDSVAAADAWYKSAVTYPFGFGLSYTTFNSELISRTPLNNAIDADGDISFDVRVTNTGSVAGKHVVQLYYEAPYIEGQVEKASRNLGAFAKTKLLKPGESQTLTLTIKAQRMASYDYNDANNNGHKGYELDAGDYNFYLSKNAHELDDGLSKVTMNLAQGKNFSTDGYTSNTVENRFDEGTPYASLPASDSGIVFTAMTRAKDASGKRLITPSAPTAEERKDLTGKITEQLNHVFYLYELEEEGSTDIRKKTKDDVIAAFGADYTQAESTTGRTFSKKFKDLAGVSKDDPIWNTVLNEFTYRELCDLILDGSNGTGVNKDFGKLGTNDSDGPIGISQVMYPCAPETAATFNVDLANKMGKMVGDEALWLNINGWRGPGFNIHRSPFNGRNFEYYSEDGYLGGMIGAKVVLGANSKGFVTYNKHLGVNEQETGRSGLITYVSEQALREIYFKPFQLACEVGHANAFMTSMGRIGNVEIYSNYPFLQNIVKDEWGFDGVLITDALNGGGAPTASANKQSFSVSGQDIEMDGAPTEKQMAYWGTWDSKKKVPTYTTEDNKTYELWSAYYGVRTSAKNLLYTTVNSNLIKNGLDLSGFQGKAFENAVGYAVSKKLVDGLDFGTKNVTYELSDGTLPAGLTLDPDGTLEGTLTAAGDYSFTVKVYVDGWVSSSATFTYKVDDAISYTGDDITAAKVGTPLNGKFTSALTTDDGFDTVTVEVDEDSELPAGLTLAEDGTLSGTPTEAGEYDVLLNVVCTKTEQGSSGAETNTYKYPQTFHFSIAANDTKKDDDNTSSSSVTPVDPSSSSTSSKTNTSSSTSSDDKKSGGCGGSVIAASTAVGALALFGVALTFKKKKEEK